MCKVSSRLIGRSYRESNYKSYWRGGAHHNMMSITNKLLLILITMTLAACSGSGGQLRPEDVPPVAEQGTTPEYRLGSGDVVSVSVWKNPDLSVTVPVRPDGFISVPLVGDVLAGGRTPAEISADTEGKLLQFLRSSIALNFRIEYA